jgi:hypothetical protein
MAIERLKLADILLDFQPPECLDFITIQEYVHAISSGMPIEPVEVFYDGSAYRLADGFHRIAALKQLDITHVMAQVTPGTSDDMEALWQEQLSAIRAELRKPPQKPPR